MYTYVMLVICWLVCACALVPLCAVLDSECVCGGRQECHHHGSRASLKTIECVGSPRCDDDGPTDRNVARGHNHLL